MSPAAALLRRLDAEATGGPWAIKDTGTVVSWSSLDGSGQEPQPGYRRVGLWNYRGGSAMMRSVFDASGRGVVSAGSRPVDGDDDTNHDVVANARAICTTRNLLPLLAGLVEVAGDVVASLDALSKAEPHQKLEAAKVSVGAHEVLRQRLAALEAAAAKEGV